MQIEMPTADNPVTLVQGDCLEVLRRLPDGCVDAVVTDPPFGARRPSARRSDAERFEEIEGNDSVRTDWLPLTYRAIRDGGAAYVFTCWDRLEQWRAAMTAAGFRVRSCIVWDKLIHGLADLDTCWAPQHELILFGAKGRHELSGKRPKDVIPVQRVNSGDLVHPYQKPTGILLPLIKASTRRGDVVLDPFAGSGTTGVACLQTDRRFIGCELDPTHYATARKRLDHASGTGKGSLFAGVAP